MRSLRGRGGLRGGRRGRGGSRGRGGRGRERMGGDDDGDGYGDDMEVRFFLIFFLKQKQIYALVQFKIILISINEVAFVARIKKIIICTYL